MTEAHGDDYAADVFDAFVATLDTIVRPDASGASVECVKHLGDGALLTAAAPQDMLRAVLDGFRSADVDELTLRVRVGVHVGELLRLRTRHGVDYLGQTANVAARLCGAARPGELLLSRAVVDAAGDLASAATAVGPRQLRHVSAPIETFAMALEPDALKICPVCQMHTTDADEAVWSAGRRWRFCSSTCRQRFTDNAQLYETDLR